MEIEGHKGYSSLVLYVEEGVCRYRVFERVHLLWAHITELALSEKDIVYLVVIENGIIRQGDLACHVKL